MRLASRTIGCSTTTSMTWWKGGLRRQRLELHCLAHEITHYFSSAVSSSTEEGTRRERQELPSLERNMTGEKLHHVIMIDKINRFKNKHLFHLAKLLGVHTKYRKNIKSVVFGQRVAFSALYYSFKRWKFKKLSMKCIVCGTRMHF